MSNSTDKFLVTIQYGKGPHYIAYMGDSEVLAKSIQQGAGTAPKKARVPRITARLWTIVSAVQQEKYPPKP